MHYKVYFGSQYQLDTGPDSSNLNQIIEISQEDIEQESYDANYIEELNILDTPVPRPVGKPENCKYCKYCNCKFCLVCETI